MTLQELNCIIVNGIDKIIGSTYLSAAQQHQDLVGVRGPTWHKTSAGQTGWPKTSFYDKTNDLVDLLVIAARVRQGGWASSMFKMAR